MDEDRPKLSDDESEEITAPTIEKVSVRVWWWFVYGYG